MAKQLKSKALSGILDRDLAIAESRDFIEKYSPYLQELINYSTNLFVRCNSSLKGIKGTHLSAFSLYYHLIQMTDGIEILISKGCFVAAIPLLRSAYESDLSIEYMLKDDFELRSAAWWVENMLKRKKHYELQNPSTIVGKEFLNALSSDETTKYQNIQLPDEQKVQRQITDIDRHLSKKYDKIVIAFKGKRGIKRWFQINNGPVNIEALAKALKKPVSYEFFYREYSEIAHARDNRYMLESNNGQIFFNPIRGDSELGERICRLAGARLINSSKLIAQKYRPEENVGEQIMQIVYRHRPDDFPNLEKYRSK